MTNGLSSRLLSLACVLLPAVASATSAPTSVASYVLDIDRNIVYSMGSERAYQGLSNDGKLATRLLVTDTTYQLIDGSRPGAGTDVTAFDSRFFTGKDVLDVTDLEGHFAYMTTTKGNFAVNLQTNSVFSMGGTRTYQGKSDDDKLSTRLLLTDTTYQLIDGSRPGAGTDVIAFDSRFFTGKDVLDVTDLEGHFAYMTTTKGNFAVNLQTNTVFSTGGERYYRGTSFYGPLSTRLLLTSSSFQLIDGNVPGANTDVTAFNTVLFNPEQIVDITDVTGRFAYFTVSNTPAVPEANTLVLALAGLSVLGWIRMNSDGKLLDKRYPRAD